MGLTRDSAGDPAPRHRPAGRRWARRSSRRRAARLAHPQSGHRAADNAPPAAAAGTTWSRPRDPGVMPLATSSCCTWPSAASPSHWAPTDDVERGQIGRHIALSTTAADGRSWAPSSATWPVPRQLQPAVRQPPARPRVHRRHLATRPLRNTGSRLGVSPARRSLDAPRGHPVLPPSAKLLIGSTSWS